MGETDIIGKSKEAVNKTTSLAKGVPSPKEGLGKLQNRLSSTKSGKGFPQTEYASLCVLSYERPIFLRNTLQSLASEPNYDYELIIHDDGSKDYNVRETIIRELHAQEGASTAIFNSPGHNQGQGTSLNRMFTLATGDPIIKLDADLHYYPGWLLATIELMKEHPEIGLLGLLHYHHDPVDSRKTVIDRNDGWSTHTHILGSAFAVRRECWEEIGPFSEHSEAFAEDWEFQKAVTDSKNWVCALPNEDLVKNLGMGLETSTVVVAEGETQHIHTEPFIVRKKK